MNPKDITALRPSSSPPPKKRTDYMFHYSDRYRSGSFDIRDISRWKSLSNGNDDYVLNFKDGDAVALTWEEFHRFEVEFDKLEDDYAKTHTD